MRKFLWNPWQCFFVPRSQIVYWYRWWKKSCTSWYGKYPIIYKVLCIPGGAGFLPSAVCIDCSLEYMFSLLQTEVPSAALPYITRRCTFIKNVWRTQEMNSTLKSFSSLQKKENKTKTDQIWKVFGVYQKMTEKNQQQTDSFDNVGINYTERPLKLLVTEVSARVGWCQTKCRSCRGRVPSFT